MASKQALASEQGAEKDDAVALSKAGSSMKGAVAKTMAAEKQGKTLRHKERSEKDVSDKVDREMISTVDKEEASVKADTKYERDEKRRSRKEANRLRTADFEAAKEKVGKREKTEKAEALWHAAKKNESDRVASKLRHLQEKNVELAEEQHELQRKVQMSAGLNAMKEMMNSYHDKWSNINQSAVETTAGHDEVVKWGQEPAPPPSAVMNATKNATAFEPPPPVFTYHPDGKLARIDMHPDPTDPRLVSGDQGPKSPDEFPQEKEIGEEQTRGRDEGMLPASRDMKAMLHGYEHKLGALAASEGFTVSKEAGHGADDASLPPPTFDADDDDDVDEDEEEDELPALPPPKFAQNSAAAGAKASLKAEVGAYSDTLQELQDDTVGDSMPANDRASDTLSSEFAADYAVKLQGATRGARSGSEGVKRVQATVAEEQLEQASLAQQMASAGTP